MCCNHCHGSVVKEYWSFCMLVGDHLLLRDIRPYGIIFMNVCYKRCHGDAGKGFWALSNVYDYVCLHFIFCGHCWWEIY